MQQGTRLPCEALQETDIFLPPGSTPLSPITRTQPDPTITLDTTTKINLLLLLMTNKILSTTMTLLLSLDSSPPSQHQQISLPIPSLRLTSCWILSMEITTMTTLELISVGCSLMQRAASRRRTGRLWSKSAHCGNPPPYRTKLARGSLVSTSMGFVAYA